MVSNQGDGSRPVRKALASYSNPAHSHIDSISRAIAGPTVLGYGFANAPKDITTFLTTNGFFATAALAVGVVIIGGLLLNEFSHLGKL